MDAGNYRVQFLITAAVSLAAVTAGVSLTWTTPSIPKFHNNQTSIHLTDGELSWLASMSSPGYMIGSVMARYVIDRFGRKSTILISAVTHVIGTVVITFAYKAWMFYIAKILWGIATGNILTASMMYLGEIAHKNIRGILTVSNRVTLSLGCFLMMSIGPFMAYDTMNYSLLILPVIYLAACWWIPESPYYLVKQGKVDAARKALRLLTGIRDETVLEEKLTNMRTDVKNEMRRKSSLKELFTGKQYRRAIVIVVGLKITQLFSGSMAVQHYFGLISQESQSGLDIGAATTIFGAVRFSVGLLAIFLIDKLGRRPLLIFSFFGTSMALFTVGSYFFAQEYLKLERDVLDHYSLVPFFGIIACSVMSFLGFDSIVYAIPAEIFPINIKSQAISSVAILAGCVSFMNVKLYQSIKDVLGLCGVFWFFGTSALLGCIFSTIFVIETKGKTFNEIQMELQGKYFDRYGKEEKLTQIVTNGVSEKNGVIHSEELKPLQKTEER